MGRAAKVGIGVGIIIAIAAIAYFGYQLSNDPNQIQRVSDFIVERESGYYRAEFALVDGNGNQVASDANIDFIIWAPGGQDKLYQEFLNIKAPDFETDFKNRGKWFRYFRKVS